MYTEYMRVLTKFENFVFLLYFGFETLFGTLLNVKDRKKILSYVALMMCFHSIQLRRFKFLTTISMLYRGNGSA